MDDVGVFEYFAPLAPLPPLHLRRPKRKLYKFRNFASPLGKFEIFHACSLVVFYSKAPRQPMPYCHDRENGPESTSNPTWHQTLTLAKATEYGLRPPWRWRALSMEARRSFFIVFDKLRRYAPPMTAMDCLLQLGTPHLWQRCGRVLHASGYDAVIIMYAPARKSFGFHNFDSQSCEIRNFFNAWRYAIKLAVIWRPSGHAAGSLPRLYCRI